MTDVMHDDASDLASARDGSDPERGAALARLYDRHAPVVISLCRQASGRGGRDLAEAEDAAQETFIRAFRKLDQLVDLARFRPWLYAIAANVCAERRRAAGRRAKHEGEAMKLHTATLNHSAEPAPERAEQLDRLGEALMRLPDDERLAIHLHYLEADPVRAAMPALGVSRSGFYKLLSRARQRLGDWLRAEQAAPGSSGGRETLT